MPAQQPGKRTGTSVHQLSWAFCSYAPGGRVALPGGALLAWRCCQGAKT